jgi:hypothetical protein
MNIKTTTFILLLLVLNIHAQHTPDYHLLFINYGFGNFGLNHQSSGESASFREIQLEYYPRPMDSGYLSVTAGIVFNYEESYWTEHGPNKYPYDLTSRIYYLGLQSEETYKYFGYEFGFIFLYRENGFHENSGPNIFFRPLVAVKLGIISQIYAFVEIDNDIILTPVFQWPPISLGITYVLPDAINSISLGYFFGYFNSETLYGYDLKVTYTVFENLLFHTQVVYEPMIENLSETENEIFCFRLGIGIKI